MEDFLSQEYWNNTIQDYLIVLGSIMLGILILRIFKSTILKRVKKFTERTEGNFDDYVVESIEKYLLPAVYFTIVYTGLKTLNHTAKVDNALSAAYTIILTYYGISLIANIVRLALRSYARKRGDGPGAIKQINGIIIICIVLVWGLGLLFLFDNLGYDVTTIIAGLGIGGIAIALAAQNILGDLFNYFVIFFDRPFEIGDFLVIGDKNGIVDEIGIKTTRIKTLSGEQLVMANSDLTNSRIHNYKKMQRRRIVYSIGVSYETSLEHLKQIPAILKEIVLAQNPVSFDRAHFLEFGDSSLNFEMVYFVENPDYNTYMDIQQEINLGIYERFEALGIVIAFPTRTLYVRNETDQKFKVESNIPEEVAFDRAGETSS